MDLSGIPALEFLYCDENQLDELDVSDLTDLNSFDCWGNDLTELDLSQNSALITLNCCGNLLDTLDVSGNAELQYLFCGGNNLEALDVTGNLYLIQLYCWGNRIESLDVAKNTLLEELSCTGNQLTSLDVSDLSHLTFLACLDNASLVWLDITETALTFLTCTNNEDMELVWGLGAVIDDLTTFEFENCFFDTDAEYLAAEQAVFDVIDLIDGLPALSELSLADADAVNTARNTYDALRLAQKQFVSNYAGLAAAEERMDDLQSGGNSGGGGGGGGISLPVYNAVLSGSGVNQTLQVSSDADAGIASVSIDAALAADIWNADGTAVISVPKIPDINAYTLEIPASSLSAVRETGNLIFDTGIGSIVIANNMLTGIADADGKTAGITVALGNKANLPDDVKAAIGDRPLIELSLALDGVKIPWNNPASPVTVSIPYSPTSAELSNPEHIVIWFIDSLGNAVAVPDGRYDQSTGLVTFATTHMSLFAVSYVQKTFDDLEDAAWAKNQIEVMASKGIITGTSESSYSPAANIKRADYLMLLVKTLGLTADFDENFDDVQPGDYYYDAAGIAKALGIAVGSGNNEFKPEETITRQDMMTLTARALMQYKDLAAAEDLTALNPFTDKDHIADYAALEIATLVDENIITGSGDRLNPLANTTRAEAAVIMYRIYNLF